MSICSLAASPPWCLPSLWLCYLSNEAGTVVKPPTLRPTSKESEPRRLTASAAATDQSAFMLQPEIYQANNKQLGLNVTAWGRGPDGSHTQIKTSKLLLLFLREVVTGFLWVNSSNAELFFVVFFFCVCVCQSLYKWIFHTVKLCLFFWTMRHPSEKIINRFPLEREKKSESWVKVLVEKKIVTPETCALENTINDTE